MDNKTLCLKPAYTESEKEVIKILNATDYWDDKAAWTYYDGRENNSKREEKWLHI